ncbi:hypothetical protein [Actinomadura sp. 9N407]|uniref:hypothetical protein n=1 Tax=Actinomadura sp. 9N407 TaxID=3375154 RepID=UPI0037B44C6C
MARAETSLPEEDLDEHVRPGPRTVVVVVLAIACLAILMIAGTRMVAELTRDPTPAERQAARTREIARRHLVWPAGQIFPAELRYTHDVGSTETARRVGIDSGTECARAVDDRLRASLTVRGCQAVLRATYLDQLQGIAVTVGVVVFLEEKQARDAAAWFPAQSPAPGLRALAFPDSVTARFTDAVRQTAAVRQRGPYVVAATAGYADGRPAVAKRDRQAEPAALAAQLADRVLGPLAAPAAIRCDAREWSC